MQKDTQNLFEAFIPCKHVKGSWDLKSLELSYIKGRIFKKISSADEAFIQMGV